MVLNLIASVDWSILAFRIHSSETTASLLEEIGGFRLEYRGVTEIKVGDLFSSVHKREWGFIQGRGNYKTFWLLGKDGFDKELPDPVISDSNHG